MSDSEKSGINLNGASRDFLDRFAKLEERVKNQSSISTEIHTDLKDIKKCLGPLTSKVYHHDKLLKIIGATGGIFLSGVFVLLGVIL